LPLSHTYGRSGTYTIVWQVTDAATPPMTSSGRLDVTIGTDCTSGPPFSLSVSGPAQYQFPCNVAVFVVDVGGMTSVTYTIDWGDGSPPVTSFPRPPGVLSTFSYQYAAGSGPGPYTVTITATDAGTPPATYTYTATVNILGC
jgi:hypothetical protein